MSYSLNVMTVLMCVYTSILMFVVYISTVPVHVCAGHVQFSKCKNSAHVCGSTMWMFVYI